MSGCAGINRGNKGLTGFPGSTNRLRIRRMKLVALRAMKPRPITAHAFTRLLVSILKGFQYRSE